MARPLMLAIRSQNVFASYVKFLTTMKAAYKILILYFCVIVIAAAFGKNNNKKAN